MSEHAPLTEAERKVLVSAWNFCDDADCTCGGDPTPLLVAVESVIIARQLRADLAARTSTATADAGLRERVEALCHRAEQRAHPSNPSSPSLWVWEVRELLDATAAPTTDTGARDE